MTLIQRLSTEADQCRNDGANDISKLLDEAVKALTPSSEAARLADEAKRLAREAIERAGSGHGMLSWPVLAAIDRLASLSASQAPAAPKVLDDPRLQELFTSCIDGALTSGYQGASPPPEGHWLAFWWKKGQAVAMVEEGARRATQQPRGEPADVYRNRQKVDMSSGCVDSADNSRCKFASGGARCVSHCGDPDCAAMASTKG